MSLNLKKPESESLSKAFSTKRHFFQHSNINRFRCTCYSLSLEIACFSCKYQPERNILPQINYNLYNSARNACKIITQTGTKRRTHHRPRWRRFCIYPQGWSSPRYWRFFAWFSFFVWRTDSIARRIKNTCDFQLPHKFQISRGFVRMWRCVCARDKILTIAKLITQPFFALWPQAAVSEGFSTSFIMIMAIMGW